MRDPSAISMRTPRSATGLMDSICSPRYNPRRPRRSRTKRFGQDRATGRIGSRGAIPGSIIKKVHSDDESQFDPRNHRQHSAYPRLAAVPGRGGVAQVGTRQPRWVDQGSDRPRRSEEHTSELQSLMRISYSVLLLKKNRQKTQY